MSETFSEFLPTPKHQSEIVLEEILRNPQHGDTIIVNPGTEDEVRYEVTHVGKHREEITCDRRAYLDYLNSIRDCGIREHIKSIMDHGIRLTNLDTVHFLYTFKGQTVRYDRNREYFIKSLRELKRRKNVFKCTRGENSYTRQY
jgi:hypothetical protein